MPIPITCTECNRKLNVPDSAAGKKVRCPACKAVVEVPEPEEDLVAPDEELVEPDEDAGITESPAGGRIMPAPEKPRKRADDEDEGGGYGMDEDDAEERQRRKRRMRRDQQDEEGIRDVRRRRQTKAHRGVLVLVLGILSMFVCMCPLICWVLAAIAVNMANADLPQMDRGHMDAEGRGMTVAGQVCAYVGTILGLITCVGGTALRTMDMLAK